MSVVISYTVSLNASVLATSKTAPGRPTVVMSESTLRILSVKPPGVSYENCTVLFSSVSPENAPTRLWEASRPPLGL